MRLGVSPFTGRLVAALVLCTLVLVPSVVAASQSRSKTSSVSGSLHPASSTLLETETRRLSRRALDAPTAPPPKPLPAALDPCLACQTVVNKTALDAMKIKLSRDEIIQKTQAVCQENQLSKALDLECSVYDDVEDWLVRGGLISADPVDYQALINDPNLFCTKVDLCTNATRVRIRRSNSTGQNNPSIVRLKLADEFAGLAKDSGDWASFVQSFVANLSQVLNISAARLELHMHSSDTLTELVIMPNPNTDDDTVAPGDTPTELAHRVRQLLSYQSDNSLLPPALAGAVDRKYRVDVAPLIIPPSVTEKPVKAPVERNASVPSCQILLRRSRTSCGESFRCDPACKRDFGAYFAKCEAPSMAQDMHDKVLKQYKEFFRICELCTDDRAALVKKRCGLKSATKELPTKCTLFCSKEFVPFYKDCLSLQLEDMPQEERGAVDTFFGSCSKCTQERVTAVQSVCDTREGRPSTPFPATCTRNCSDMYVPFFDGCLDGEPTGVPEGSRDFKARCVVAADGGIAFRTRLRLKLSNIDDKESWKTAYIQTLASLLQVNATRFQVTLVQAEVASAAQARFREVPVGQETGNILVDANLLNSDNILDADPRTLIAQLRAYIANPASALYGTSMGGIFDSTFGCTTLIYGTHNPNTQDNTSLVELAKTELLKAMEAKAAPEIIDMLKAIVAYQEAVAKPEPPAAVATALKAVTYFALIAKQASEPKIAAAKADYQYAASVSKNLPSKVQAVYQAIADYMADVANDAPTAIKERDAAILKLRKAVEYGAKVEQIQLMEAIVQYLTDLAAKQSRERILFDSAVVDYMKDVAGGKSPNALAADRAVVEYMRTLAEGMPRPFAEAAEANVEYLKAVLAGEAPALLKERSAIVDYMNAVADRKDPDELARLAKLVLAAHEALADSGPK